MQEKRGIRSLITHLCKMGMIMLASAVAGVLLLTLVYMIPVDGCMKEHAWQALEVFEQEGVFPKLWGENMGSRLDNFTDALMIQTAVFEGEGSPLERAIEAGHIQNNPYTADPVFDLRTQLEGESGTVSEYAKYWHGYLLFLKPLLFLFSYSQIRMLNGVVQILLVIALMRAMCRRRLGKYILPFLVSLLAIAIWILPFSMQNSCMFYIAVIGTLFMVSKYDFIKKYRYIYYMILGISTSFFDFLTYPVVSVGIPLVFFWLLRNEEGNTLTLKEMLRETFFAGLHWGVGYAGFWAVKWLLGGALLGGEMLCNTIASLEARSLGDTEQPANSYIVVCLRNVRRLLNLAFCSTAFVYICCCILRYTKKFYLRIKDNVIFVFLACIPFAWYFVTRNHADIHIHFAYRNLWITVFAILCIFRNLISEIDERRKKVESYEGKRE